MNTDISAMMDGAPGESSSDQVLRGLVSDEDSRKCWETYHLIGDVLRGNAQVRRGFTDEVMEHLAKEPTVLAPSAAASRRSNYRIFMPLAASLAGIGAVAWVAQALNSGPEQTTLVQMQRPVAAGVQSVAAMPSGSLAEAAKPSAPKADRELHLSPQLREYLLVHRGFPPTDSIHGGAGIVGSVSESGRNPSQ
ncbi:MAG: sigma-E factor negative regulatory protein [Betaproteobacteria bacterium]|nr:sigma-E factor negative regulatory protein [Betaproteobacteria bacterium]